MYEMTKEAKLLAACRAHPAGRDHTVCALARLTGDRAGYITSAKALGFTHSEVMGVATGWDSASGHAMPILEAIAETTSWDKAGLARGRALGRAAWAAAVQGVADRAVTP